MKIVVACAGIAAAAVLAGGADGRVLLSLLYPPVQTDTPYALSFRATAGTTTLYVGGFELPYFEQVTQNSVSTSSSGNLLGSTWIFAPAAVGSLALQYSDGSSVNALDFGGMGFGYYDVFSQNFATVPGATYTYDFNFTQQHAGPSGFYVSTATPGPGIPEPGAWVLTLLGVAGVAGAARLARRRAPAAA